MDKMSFISNALSGNPFSTPVGAKIEQATDGTLASENWSLNMEICDLINETEEGSRDAIKAIRKRLTQNAGKNYTIVMYTLIVLETCVKNCGRKFHILVCKKDFIQELVNLIGPKNDPPTAVQEKVLSLIQTWADAFQGKPDMSGVVTAYQDLLAKGIEFPPTDLDSLAPIHTPIKSVEPEIPVGVEAHNSDRVMVELPSPTGSLSIEQRVKLQSELDVVQSNMNVLGEMLSELKPGHEQPDELELLQELNVVCQSMQERLVDLISKLSNDELTAELLRINDDMNNLLLRYSRWEKNRGPGSQSASAVLAKAIPPSAKPVLQSEDSLIDFGDDLPEQLNKMTVASGHATAQLSSIESVNARSGAIPKESGDDFDMFAKSRNVTYESSKTSGSSYKDNLNPDQVQGGLNEALQGKSSIADREFDEMANWLGQTGIEESVTSSEFDKFLAERAAAVENLPSAAGSTNASSTPANQKTSKDEKSLFAM